MLDKFLILPFGVQGQPIIIVTLRRRRFFEIHQKPFNCVVHVFHTYVDAPQKDGPRIIDVEAI